MFFQERGGKFADCLLTFSIVRAMIGSTATIKLSVDKNTIVKGEIFLMKKDYMDRLERAARWRLPRQEAEDVIADYWDIVGQPPRPEEELRRDVGDPEQVVKLLMAPPRAYRIWLAVFAVMAACILIPVNCPVPLFLPDKFGLIWVCLFSPYVYLFIPGFHMYLWLMIPGIVLSLAWFRPRKGEPKASLPRPLIVTLIVEFALMAAVWWCFYQFSLYPDGIMFQPALITHWLDAMNGWTTPHSAWAGEALQWGGIAVGIAGVVALVKARTQNRRWRAAYVMSFALMMLAFCLLNQYSFLDPSDGFASMEAHTRQCCTVITIIGLAGTGVALI